MYAMFDELPSIYADRLQNQKDHKFFGQSIQSLYAMLTGQEDPMLTARKISCGSCQKPVYKIDGLRAPHNAWNNPAATTIYKMDQHAKSQRQLGQRQSMSTTDDIREVEVKGTVFQHPIKTKIAVSPGKDGLNTLRSQGSVDQTKMRAQSARSGRQKMQRPGTA